MKKLAFAAVFALAACSQAEEAPVAEETAAAPEPVAMTAADGGTSEGTYEITTSDGTVATQVVNADGTYVMTGPDGETETGTWRQESSSRWCETKEGASEEICFNETVDADGVWSSADEKDPTDIGIIVRKS